MIRMGAGACGNPMFTIWILYIKACLTASIHHFANNTFNESIGIDMRGRGAPVGSFHFYQDQCLFDIMVIKYKNYNMFKYIKLADFLQTLIHKKLQIKDLIYSQQQKYSANGKKQSNAKVNPCVAYSNLSLTLNNLYKFEEMYKKLCVVMRKKKEKVIANKYLLFVMVAEYINVKKIVGGGKLKKIIMENLNLLPDIHVQSKINKSVISIRFRPWGTKSAECQAKCQMCQIVPNWHSALFVPQGLIRLRQAFSKNNQQQYQKWKKILLQFGSEDSMIPLLFNLLQDRYSQLVSQHQLLRTSSACVIQSFSSNLPPFLLFQGLINNNNMNKNFDIIDACSAPGNKTLQLSQYLGNRGTVYAFEKDQRRYTNLCRNMQKYGASNVQTENKNFLQTKKENFNKVKLILLDPSCSGSGMLTNFTRDYVSDQEKNKEQQSFQEFVDNRYQNLPDKQKQRVNSLKQFQLQLLNHSAKFSPQRISYSTCSIYRQQNQEVVKQFLMENKNYHIKNVTKGLNGHKSMQPGFGKKYKNCIRIDPRDKLSDGFFVCILSKMK